MDKCRICKKPITINETVMINVKDKTVAHPYCEYKEKNGIRGTKRKSTKKS